MSLREIDKIQIFKKISKYRRIRLLNVVQVIAKMMLLPVAACVIILIFVKIPDGAKAEGTLEQPNKLTVFSRVNASVSTVFILPGAFVTNGQVLLSFNSNEIISALVKQKNGISALSNQLKSLEFQLKSFYIQWNLEMRQKKKELDRKESFYHQDMASLDEYELAKNQYELSALKHYQAMDMSNQISTIKANLDSALNGLAIQDEMISNTIISSVMEGIAVFDEEKIIPGYEVKKGEELFQVLPEEKVIAKLMIPEKSMSKVKEGQAVEVYPAAFPKEKYKGLKGELYYLSPNAIKGFFIGKARLEKDTVRVKTDGGWQETPLSYGMTLTAKIITVRKPIYEFLLGLNGYE